MGKLICFLAFFVFLNCQSDTLVEKSKQSSIVIVVHGGAGNILKKDITPELEKEYTLKLEQALTEGYTVLENGGSSLEAVEKAVKILEDAPLFNAGKGSVLTAEGTVEMDASIMEGKELKAGAVAGVSQIKNPVSLARLVMEKSNHVLLIGEGAENFAREMGMELVDSSYFYTEKARKQLQKIKERERMEKKDQGSSLTTGAEKYGTVGAVALDASGNLAAATSTGGMANKRFGRVGDSPIIGAGTYANNATCAISCTGHGEYFIRLAVAHEISAMMEFLNLSIEEAMDRVIAGKLEKSGGTGGCIGVDSKGNVSMKFNTSGMFRGYKKGAEMKILIYN